MSAAETKWNYFYISSSLLLWAKNYVYLTFEFDFFVQRHLPNLNNIYDKSWSKQVFTWSLKIVSSIP